MDKTISVRNTHTGAVSEVTERRFANSVLFNKDVFVKVEEGSKSYVPELYKSRSADEFTAQHPEKVVNDEPVEDESETEEIEEEA